MNTTTEEGPDPGAVANTSQAEEVAEETEVKDPHTPQPPENPSLQS